MNPPSPNDPDLDDLEFDDIDWEATPPLHRRVWQAARESWARLGMSLGLRPRQLAAVEKLSNLIVINAHRRGAAWVEIRVHPHSDDSAVEVLYGVRGEARRELTPPRKLLEPIADFFQRWCSFSEEFVDAPTFRGAVTLSLGNGTVIPVRVVVRRPEGEASAIFLQF